MWGVLILLDVLWCSTGFLEMVLPCFFLALKGRRSKILKPKPFLKLSGVDYGSDCGLFRAGSLKAQHQILGLRIGGSGSHGFGFLV